MYTRIKKSKFSKNVAAYLAVQLVLQMIQPMQALALTGGPAQPEFNSFTPIGTSDMVNLSSGDFSYNIPLMDVGGYPLNLAYSSGITMDQEATWVGLGWNLNVGQINRNVRGLPDDFDGDKLTYETKIKPNRTTGFGVKINPQFLGIETTVLGGTEVTDAAGGISVGLLANFNNYEGISFRPSFGFSFDVSDNLTVGLNVSSSVAEGASVSPNAKLSSRLANSDKGFVNGLSGDVGFGVSTNSRQGLTSFNVTPSLSTNTNLQTKGDGKLGRISGSGNISFVNNTFTPVKRNAFKNTNLTFRASSGFSIFGIDAEVGVEAFSTIQELSGSTGGYVSEEVKSFGYLNSNNASRYDILDFNKEKDNAVSENTLVLPSTTFTHDVYSISGQGISGMFRPFKGQVGYVYDRFIQDEGSGSSFGGEAEGGVGFHAGLDISFTQSESHTGRWDTNATSFFKPSIPASDQIDYERTYFKSIGEMRIDDESELLYTNLGGLDPITLDIVGSPNSPGKYASNKFRKKTYGDNNQPMENLISFNSKLKRNHREKRNQAITHFSAGEISMLQGSKDGPFKRNQNSIGKDHHIGAMTILQPDGSTYVYGETAYNNLKEEVTFATNQSGDCSTGIVQYQENENSDINSSGLDNYFNKVTTPSYAHTYLLSSVLSVDYEDLTGDGPSDDDFGSYTKFYYEDENDGTYKWRIPYTRNKESDISDKAASFNEGLKTEELDQKGSYIYGEKETKYISKIETKTHVAIFNRSSRLDGYGVSDVNETAGIPDSKMFKLDSIELFTKSEYNNYLENLDTDTGESSISLSPIKVAHFVYDYSQCKNIDNNYDEVPDGDTSDPDYYVNEGGKLTLKKMYFTYRNSKMGKYTPYTFEYNGLNPDYSLKSHDIWGNYKQNSEGGCNVSDPISNSEFPFVQQFDEDLQDDFSSAWSLTDINLPSGGKMNVEYESDDYQYVQNRRALQMYKVVGVSSGVPGINDVGANSLYNPDFFNIDEAKHIIVEIPDDVSVSDFQSDYIGGLNSKPIFFKFLTQMVRNQSNSYDYISGYFNIDQSLTSYRFNDTDSDGQEHFYASVPVEFSDLEGGLNGNKQVNPISKAAWYFGRQNLNNEVYGIDYNAGEENLQDIIDALGSSIGALVEIWQGPNQNLRSKQSGRLFNPEKSWIRLQHSGSSKMGGGTRVKTITLNDNWDQMLQKNGLEYQSIYGQQYDYTNIDGGSSGVATFEPNGSKENAFVEPFYNKSERLVAPRSTNYVEKPFGESFFPASTVTYGRVTVKNIEQEYEGQAIQKHATGRVINEFYTSYDFPTITDHTDLNDGGFYSNENDIGATLLASFLKLEVKTKTELTLSQGFVVRTNDMNGRDKSQKVLNESGDLISGVDYKYSLNENNTELDNFVPVIASDGSVSNEEIGVHYDVTTDFRESYSRTEIAGAQGNLAVIPILIGAIISVTIFPESSDHKKILHTTTTTKVIHHTGVMKEKIAYDLGSRVSTKNLAWDAESGQVLLTQTINEYDDNYYNFTYPSHWYYSRMDRATNNLNIVGKLQPNEGEVDSDSRHLFSLSNGNGQSASDIFALGDEILATQINEETGATTYSNRLWIAALNGNQVTLMNRFGKVINQSCSTQYLIDGALSFRIIRSGYRNLQGSSMASVTAQTNPLRNSDNSLKNLDLSTFLTSNLQQGEQSRIINASAVRYNEYWKPQREYNLRRMPSSVVDQFDSALNTFTEIDVAPENYGFNPYLYNVLGDWKAVNSYAYLTGRKTAEVSPRREGFFTSFKPYYYVEGGDWKTINSLADSSQENDGSKWTFASQISQISPYGAELENRDALNRYSSAQYGYNYSLPTAVASNSKYQEIGFDGFEDYFYRGNFGNSRAHFAIAPAQIGIVPGASVPQGPTRSAELSDEYAHSGRYSLKVESEHSYARILSSNEYEVTQPTCPDEVDETITVVEGGSCTVPRLDVTITGEPNDEVEVIFYFIPGTATEICGQLVNINGDIFNDQTAGISTLSIPSNGILEIAIRPVAEGYFPNEMSGTGFTFSFNGTRNTFVATCDDATCTNDNGDPVGGY